MDGYYLLGSRRLEYEMGHLWDNRRWPDVHGWLKLFLGGSHCVVIVSGSVWLFIGGRVFMDC